jgi:hypothetical protein
MATFETANIFSNKIGACVDTSLLFFFYCAPSHLPNVIPLEKSPFKIGYVGTH